MSKKKVTSRTKTTARKRAVSRKKASSRTKTTSRKKAVSKKKATSRTKTAARKKVVPKKKATTRKKPAGRKKLGPGKKLAAAQARTISKKKGAVRTKSVAGRNPVAAKRRASTRGDSVYFFGAGKADGQADMKETLGGKGANLAEMTRLGVPCPARSHDFYRCCVCGLQPRRRNSEPVAAEVSTGRSGQGGEGDGRRVWRSRPAPARLRALRGPRLDARHDGHRAEPGPQRHHGPRPGPSCR